MSNLSFIDFSIAIIIQGSDIDNLIGSKEDESFDENLMQKIVDELNIHKTGTKYFD